MAADRDLVRRMLAGDEEAFGEWFDGYFPALYRFAFVRVGRNHSVAEDVVQAALCRAVGKLDTWRGEAPLFTWLCTFCRHEISSHFERQGATATAVELLEDSPEIRAALESLARNAPGGPEVE